MRPDTLKIALWSVNFNRQISNLGNWLELVEQQITNAKSQGAELLILPEYASEHWLAFAPETLAPTDEIAWMAGHSKVVLTVLQALSQQHDIAILAGTFPVACAEGFNNRAHFVTPDGAMIAQDKLSLTPNETNPDAWNLQPGTDINLFTWQGLNLAILTCLDIEMPALSILLAPHNIDLVLVPSMTRRLAGYHRVFGCAKARAIELQTAVAVVGPVGNVQQGELTRGDNTSGAALYVPCEESLDHQGIAAFTEVNQGVEPAALIDEMLFATVPCRQIRELREGLAEVWPGGWSSDHVTVNKP
ncbi:MAG: nitrilase-related carbon-nitrogen hydrolase [Paracoccaceae bacterium]